MKGFVVVSVRVILVRSTAFIYSTKIKVSVGLYSFWETFLLLLLETTFSSFFFNLLMTFFISAF